MRVSLRVQLLSFLTILIGSTMWVTGYFIIRQQEEELTQAIQKKGEATASQLAGSLLELLEGRVDITGTMKMVKMVQESDSDIVDLVVVDPSGKVVGAMDPDKLDQHWFPSHPDAIPFFREIRQGEAVLGRLGVWISKNPIRQAVARAQRGIVEVTAMFMVVAILASFLLAERIVQPVKRLAAGVAKMGQGHFDVVVPVTTRNEVGDLTEAFNQTAKSLKEKEHLKSVAKSYMGQEVVDQAMSIEGDPTLGGERRMVTILFSDIRDFTTMSEKMKPEEVVAMLNEYFSEMTAIVVRNGGFVDKFMGDAIMAVFGIPKPRTDHAELAVKTSVEMLQRLVQLHGEWERAGKPIIKMGIGLNTGEVVVGNIGSQDRMSYTIIGDPANVASRVQALNKTYHTTLLFTDRTYEAVTGKVPFILQPVEKVQIRGRTEPVQLYTIRV